LHKISPNKKTTMTKEQFKIEAESKKAEIGWGTFEEV